MTNYKEGEPAPEPFETPVNSHWYEAKISYSRTGGAETNYVYGRSKERVKVKLRLHTTYFYQNGTLALRQLTPEEEQALESIVKDLELSMHKMKKDVLYGLRLGWGNPLHIGDLLKERLEDKRESL